MGWETVSRPGQLGKNRANLISQWNEEYGEGNWRIVWVWCDNVVGKDMACHLYEHSYLVDSFNREDLWKELVETALDIYDMEKRDIESGYDYNVQKGPAIHLQDIAMRRVARKRLWEFKGDELVQVRKHGTYWGDIFSPGKVSFYRPDDIKDPHLKSWWDRDSVEDFYQSNKVLQARIAGDVYVKPKPKKTKKVKVKLTDRRKGEPKLFPEDIYVKDEE
jgi:hypothetical protein